MQIEMDKQNGQLSLKPRMPPMILNPYDYVHQ